CAQPAEMSNPRLSGSGIEPSPPFFSILRISPRDSMRAFARPEYRRSNAEARRKVDVYFNIVNGTGPIYGWYAQNDETAKRILDQWLEPPEGIRSAAEHTGAGRQYGSPVIHCSRHTQLYPIQDYTNYDVRTHHTNMDTADRLSVNDIRQAA